MTWTEIAAPVALRGATYLVPDADGDPQSAALAVQRQRDLRANPEVGPWARYVGMGVGAVGVLALLLWLTREK